ncbi:DUF302 domain-containing protein [Halapricum desulfuricans]|uniref:DUF302 family n=1 Tax=Halapricum desulfuricans TaxID=2841257 RepID=A0A897NHM4_9EURY|nr:DUF302 domain-containing protein [Halapricum desulfuricans]QSG09049.1 DUF302 family [Halapricum desulfuricans]QSG12217.1 DUF302 family [Halapricum desulfuricans]
MAPYTHQYRVDAPFDETIEIVTDALAEEGFGVLSDIDMQAAFEEKLDKEHVRYRILGACNPPLAYDAIDVEFEIGALLPCNVVVYETDGDETGVSVVDPTAVLTITENEAVEPIAEEVSSLVEAAFAAIPNAEPVSA